MGLLIPYAIVSCDSLIYISRSFSKRGRDTIIKNDVEKNDVNSVVFLIKSNIVSRDQKEYMEGGIHVCSTALLLCKKT